MNLLHKDLTDKIIRAYYNVFNTLGYGFLERPYENAMMIELEEMGLKAVKQHPIKVHYKGRIIGDYFADILVENKVILELKATIELHPKHEIQLRNYLKATDIEVGLLLNFGKEAEFSRKIFENRFK
ncbi:MAG: GxxExxY protein [Saprospiraceae bacterium]